MELKEFVDLGSEDRSGRPVVQRAVHISFLTTSLRHCSCANMSSYDCHKQKLNAICRANASDNAYDNGRTESTDLRRTDAISAGRLARVNGDNLAFFSREKALVTASLLLHPLYRLSHLHAVKALAETLGAAA